MPTIKVTTGSISLADILNQFIEGLESESGITIEEDGDHVTVYDKQRRNNIDVCIDIELDEETEIEEEDGN